MPKLEGPPNGIKPYVGHGLALTWDQSQSDQAVGDCPFCAREHKFYVHLESGQADCKVCQWQGNGYSFMKKLWEESRERTTDAAYMELAQERKLLSYPSLQEWGLARSIITEDWLIPAYNIDGALTQLYIYRKDVYSNRMAMMPTMGISHALMGVPLFDRDCEVVYLCEGVWDAVALWEILGRTKKTPEGYEPTGAIGNSLLSNSSVLAVATANTFREQWVPLFSGRRIYLLYDSDHPRLLCAACKKSYSIVEHKACPLCNEVAIGKTIRPGGLAGMERASKMLAGDPRSSVHYLRWGQAGYDAGRPTGFDVRDWLSTKESVTGRCKVLSQLVDRCIPVPKEWIPDEPVTANDEDKKDLEPLPCDNYSELVNAWRKAMHWRRDMGDALSVMLATAISTLQTGDQLFLQVIADAGSGKTRFCDAMLVSPKCYPLEHLTGFFSGWRDASGKDFSLIARINGHCCITPEGDVMMSTPRFSEIMSQQRRIFDGSSGATYKNKDEDTRYVGLRTPWIMAGTPALLDKDQSRLGDRFLKVWINPPTAEEEDDILMMAGYAAIREVRQTSNCSQGSTLDERMSQAYRLTAGYVDYLCSNAGSLLADIDAREAWLVPICRSLAKFTASMRARPAPDRKKNEFAHERRELPTRLTKQFGRLALCLAAVLNKKEADEEVVRRVKKVAFDTAGKHSVELATVLYEAGDRGMDIETIIHTTRHREEEDKNLLYFMRRIEVAELFTGRMSPGVRTPPRWRLTKRMAEIYSEVMEICPS